MCRPFFLVRPHRLVPIASYSQSAQDIIGYAGFSWQSLERLLCPPNWQMTVFINARSADRVGRRPSVNALSTYVCHFALLVHAILGIRASPNLFRRTDSQDRMDRQEAWQGEVKPELTRLSQSAGGGDPKNDHNPVAMVLCRTCHHPDGKAVTASVLHRTGFRRAMAEAGCYPLYFSCRMDYH